MMPEHVPNAPVLTGQYAPYFYASGLYRVHDIPLATVASGGRDLSAARYDFTSDLVRRRSAYHPQTVEDIVAHGYLAIPSSEPEFAMISDKADTSWLGLDDLIGQVRQRHAIYQSNLYEIEQAKCYAITHLLAMEAERGGMPANSRETESLTKQLQELYQDQRTEKVCFWQDVSRLRLQLPENAQQYLSAYRKVSILEDDEGDAL